MSWSREGQGELFYSLGKLHASKPGPDRILEAWELSSARSLLLKVRMS